jgi:hypothetical protein
MDRLSHDGSDITAKGNSGLVTGRRVEQHRPAMPRRAQLPPGLIVELPLRPTAEWPRRPDPAGFPRQLTRARLIQTGPVVRYQPACRETYHRAPLVIIIQLPSGSSRRVVSESSAAHGI